METAAKGTGKDAKDGIPQKTQMETMNPTAHNSHRGHRPRSCTSPEGQQTLTCLSIGSPSTRIDFAFVCEEQAVVLTADNLADTDTGCCWSLCSQAHAEGADQVGWPQCTLTGYPL